MHSVPRPRRSPSGRLGLGLIAAFALLAGTVFAALAPAAQALTVEKMFAGNCEVETCGFAGGEVHEPSLGESEAQGFREAGGYVPFGVTAFRFETEEIPVPLQFGVGLNRWPKGFPEGSARFIRTDVAPGVVTNPFAPGLAQCANTGASGFEGIQIRPEEGPTKPALFVYPVAFGELPSCPASSLIGIDHVLSVEEPEANKFAAFPLEGRVFNLETLPGFAATYGANIYTGSHITLDLGLGEGSHSYKVYTHTIIEGNVEWASDYHDYFEIHNIPVGLIESRLIFYGNKALTGFTGEENTGLTPTFGGERKFIRNPTSCNPPGPATTTHIRAVPLVGAPTEHEYKALVGTEPETCHELTPFVSPNLGFEVKPETTATDAPNGITVESTVNHPSEASKPDVADLSEAVITLPPGMTMNPSAAAGLEACTESQFNYRSRQPTACPAGSRIGTVALEVPTLPPGSLTGFLYLGNSGSGAITAPPYTIYLLAESTKYGVSVRLKGTVSPNGETGQLTTTFAGNPEAPYNKAVLHFNGGVFAPIANPLSCGTATTTATLLPYSLESGAFLQSPFTVGSCASPQFTAPPLSQSLAVFPKTGGSESNFTFTITRPQGQQYLSQMKTVLPPGLVAKIPSVPLCPEANANAGTCPTSSRIGVVRVLAGSGEPFAFNGEVFLTEHYEGAPYGLDIVTPTQAGPFNFGPINTRAKINVNQNTAQVEVTIVRSFVKGTAVSGLPTIVGGIPTRIRSITVAITHSNYVINPTNCGALTSQTTLTSTLGASALISSPFQVENCSSLAFKPSFKATSSSKTSRQNGASLNVNITQPSGEANIGSVVTTLPKQLPSRLTTLQKACVLATFEANPSNCPKESNVGTAEAVTPTLPGTMKGPAYIVSRGAAFPDLELVLESNGVRVILDGKTNIKNSITTTTFGSNPDVPISSFSLRLPTGKFSLLAANGNFCKPKLLMPTTITGQNGKKLTQKTHIEVQGCLPILSHRVRGKKLTFTVKTPQAGRVRVSGHDLGIETRHLKKSQKVTITVALAPSGEREVRKHGHLKIKVKVGFVPKSKNGAAFTSYINATFRR